MVDQDFDVAVIGGGIVGLATALQLCYTFPRQRLLLLEKEDRIASHQSGHNSGVIHSGIYYKPGSLKARLCVEGSAAMVEFCRVHNIKHNVCGKIIVATAPEEFPYLRTLYDRAQANGLQGVKLLTREQVREYEPHCCGLRGLHVPSSGIADYIAVCDKYAELIVKQGSRVCTGAEVRRITQSSGETILETARGAFSVRHVINCAGLHSDRICKLAGHKPEVEIIPFRGEYYDLIPEKEYLVKSLIYPVPDPRFPFLGVHFTQRIHGGVDAGPNAVLALSREGYRWSDISIRDTAGTLLYPGFWFMAAKYWTYGAYEVYRSLSKAAFAKALQRLVPEIQSADLVPDGSGVRAQALRRDGSLLDDFQFQRNKNLLNVCNVPSPAATASLSIGKAIADIAKQDFGLTA